MIVVMEVNSTEPQVEAVIERMMEMGFSPSRTTGQSQTLIAGVGHGAIDLAGFEAMAGVKEAHRISSPFKLASRVWRPEGTRVALSGAVFGGGACIALARVLPGQAEAAASAGVAAAVVATAKARFGYEKVEIETLRSVRREAAAAGLPVIAEIMDPARVEPLGAHCDAFLTGAAQMQNYALLDALGRQPRPVILERGLAATIEEWLMAAEVVLAGGNPLVVLCERGIKTFDTGSATTLDLAAIPALQRLSHLPVIVDPRRATGKTEKVLALSRAAVAAGADGVVLDAGPELAGWMREISRLTALRRGTETQ